MNSRNTYKTAAWWYACGANDTRRRGQPYVDPDLFANYVVERFDAFMNHETNYYASIQDSWKEYTTQ
jgi:hypothetical protein